MPFAKDGSSEWTREGVPMKGERVDGQFIEREVTKLTDMSSEDEGYDLAVVMLASVPQGPNVKRIAKFLDWRRDRVSTCGARLRETGIWNGRKIAGAAWLEEDGGIAFNLDVAVAIGYLEHVE